MSERQVRIRAVSGVGAKHLQDMVNQTIAEMEQVNKTVGADFQVADIRFISSPLAAFIIYSIGVENAGEKLGDGNG